MYAPRMTWLWVLMATAAGLVLLLIAWIGVRDRRRLSSGDDRTASRDAAATAERYAAERHGAQGATSIENQMHGNG